MRLLHIGKRSGSFFMFERNTVDNGTSAVAVAVDIDLTDGRSLSGNLVVSRSKDVHAVLNGPDPFLVFEPFGGARQYIAKSMLAGLRVHRTENAPRLQSTIPSANDFDPHRILGVARDAVKEEIREAFVAQSKAYHPDRYATAELPGEVVAYLEGMSRRINAAYEALGGTPSAAQRDAAKPIYKRRPAQTAATQAAV
jgi:hypothetical protein